MISKKFSWQLRAFCAAGFALFLSCAPEPLAEPTCIGGDCTAIIKPIVENSTLLNVNGPHFIPFLFLFFPYNHFDNSAIPSSNPFSVNGYILLSNKSLKIHTDDV